MLEIVKRIRMKRATDAAVGDVQVFLERLLVEVVAGNYRHFLNERIELSKDGDLDSIYQCWPPLFANERQVSGIFASALNTMSPSTVPEHKIRRRLEREEDEELKGTAGRVDFLSTFGRRTIGLELKGAAVSTTAGGDYTVLKTLWDRVVDQSKEAHTFMRQPELRADYPEGTGIGLMVVRVARHISGKYTLDSEANLQAESIDRVVQEIQRKLKPDFMAKYLPPIEMQTVQKEKGYRIFSCIVFAAVVHGKAESLRG